ncbi:MAG: hypothetical protein GXX83_05215 [Gaiellales bacterium]|nr:hypothetical protein [Gaiellales bacterium]
MTPFATRFTPLLLGLTLLLAGCTAGPSASTSTTAAQSPPLSTSSTTAATSVATGVTVHTTLLPSPEPESLNLEDMVAACDLVVYGRVLAELPGRWNGPNADRWTPETPGDACIIYRSWIVQSMAAVVGFAPVGDLLTVHCEGGTVPGDEAVTMVPDGPEPEIGVGDQVLLFLRQDDVRYGGTYQPIGYWLQQGAAGAFVQVADGGFRRSAEAAGGAEERVDIDMVRAAADAAEAGGGSAADGGEQGPWRKGMSLAETSQWLAGRLPSDQTIILPPRLPEGWAVADDGQPFPDGVSSGIAHNPWVQTGGQTASPKPYRVVFTDGGDVAALVAYQVGDWGETPFHTATEGRIRSPSVFSCLRRSVVSRRPPWFAKPRSTRGTGRSGRHCRRMGLNRSSSGIRTGARCNEPATSIMRPSKCWTTRGTRCGNGTCPPTRRSTRGRRTIACPLSPSPNAPL